ncbi:MAG: AAA family ATPase [Prevotellaceae bacterium]|nr:AAA family ATPase [Prevotellaceae bacterium]MDY3856399.1 AAA family ATPase [Bacteroidaceae bacterium]
MIVDAFLQCLQQQFPFQLTAKQTEAARRLCLFLYSSDPQSMFILRGYAGTGKTTLVSSIVRVLHQLKLETVLLAPTGRAAKVFSLNAGYPAYTIHKEIYRQHSLTSEQTHFDLDHNKHKAALFVVDESSMISAIDDGQSVFGTGSLLADLLQYVYSVPGCRILFVGDNAQLPPVGSNISPALSVDFFTQLGYHVSGFQLTEVMRQTAQSGILHNATALRHRIHDNKEFGLPVIKTRGYKDIVCLHGQDILDTLEECYEGYGQDQTIVLTRSNKQANAYNKGIRQIFFDRDDTLTLGDMVMVVRNNYYWTERLRLRIAKQQKQDKPTLVPPPMDFIANGDIAQVISVGDEYEFYDLHFADVRLRFPDYDNFELNARVILDVLQSDTPALPTELDNKLYLGVSADYAQERNKRERMKRIREDANYNALQLKFAYAVTCHKAQGGQWRNVFVDQGWLPPEAIDRSYYRWLYTAMTRATDKLYLVNWPEKQIEGE